MSKKKSHKQESEVGTPATPSTPTFLVAIMTGSPSDLPVVVQARDVLDELGVPNDLRVLSAHRTPHDAVAYVEAAEQAGVEVFIACAGMSAHLAGVVAAHTTRPVIGVPLKSTALDGMDALLSTVMMPPGIPVATVAIDGAKNAAFLAARILAGSRPELRERLVEQLAEGKKRYDSPVPGSPAQGDDLGKRAAKKKK